MKDWKGEKVTSQYFQYFLPEEIVYLQMNGIHNCGLFTSL
jgi:hypothetical protein